MRRKKSAIKKISGTVIIIAAAFFGYFVFTGYHAKNNARYYRQGLDFIAKKDYQNAYYNFSSAEKGNEYYCPAKYRAALAAQNLYDTDSAILMYKDVINGCANTIFEEVSKYNLAKFYYQQKNYKKAEPLFLSLEKSARTEKYKVAANYFLGEMQAAKSPKKAFNYFLEYLKKSPDGKFSKPAINAVLGLNLPLNTEAHSILGRALYENTDYAAAKRHFLYVPMEKSWYYLAMCALKSGDAKQAKTFLAKGIAEYSQYAEEKDLQNALDIFASYFSDKKSGYSYLVNTLVPKGAAGGDYALYEYISFLPAQEKIPYYHKIVDKYPKGNFAADANRNLLYLQYKRKNYQKVMSLADEHVRRYPQSAATPAVLFFAGKSADKSGKFNKAKEYYGRVLAEYPDDYYAFRAKLNLNDRKTAWTFKNKYSVNYQDKNIPFPLNYCTITSNDRASLNFLVKVKDWALLSDLLGDNDIVKSWVNYNEGNKSMSIVQARDFLANVTAKPAFSSPIYKLAYPLYYVDEVNRYSKVYDLDAFVVMSIIREESYFTYNAKSYVGAGGLMQVMPDTARFIAKEYGLNYDSAMHNDAAHNIELGCAYLDYALGKLSKKYLFAVAGYNGGHNAVNRWRNNLNYSDFDEFVEEVPYAETQTYIKKVFKSYWNYLNIYDNTD